MVRAASASLCSPKLPFKRPLDAGVDASKNPPFWTDATKIREEPNLMISNAPSLIVLSRLVQFENGFASIKERFIGRLAIEGVMRHHFVMLLNLERDSLANRFERIKSLLKQAIVFRRSPARFDHRVREQSVDLRLHMVHNYLKNLR